jgi:fermentation-respiration switch protein FrsA (DUF1100 family)
MTGQFITAPCKTLLRMVENRLLYHPTVGGVTTGALWQPELKSRIEPVFFSSQDGTRLHGWYVRPRENKPTLLLAHGNAGDISHREWIMKPFTDKGYGFFAFDYRGFGLSGGTPSEAGLYQDFDAASDFLTREKGIAPTDQIAMGESLGGAVAIDAASRRPFRALYVMSTFTSLPNVALAVKNRIPVLRYLPDFLIRRLIQQPYNSIDKIGQVKIPVVVAHGDQDSLVPHEMGKALSEKATAAPYRKLVTIPGADHNNLFVGPEAWEHQLTAALDDMLGETAPSARPS